MGAALPPVSRLIVGTSGSPGSLQALRYGESLARAHHAVLIPVLAWQPPGGDRGSRIEPSGDLRRACRDLACQRLRDALIAAWGEVPEPLVSRVPGTDGLESLHVRAGRPRAGAGTR
jgi:hypothetical protein